MLTFLIKYKSLGLSSLSPSPFIIGKESNQEQNEGRVVPPLGTPSFSPGFIAFFHNELFL